MTAATVCVCVCGLWLLPGSADRLLAAAPSMSLKEEAPGSRQEPAGAARESDGDGADSIPTPPARRLDSRQLTLGGMFMGNVYLPASRPLPNSTPSHEEIKAAVTPPEFRSTPAVSFGWSWRGRRR